MTTSKVILLEDLLADDQQQLNNFREVLLMALLDPSSAVREMVIAEINRSEDRFLRRMYVKEEKIYAGMTDRHGNLHQIYVANIPQEYFNQPAVPHPFDLDAN